MPQQRKQYTEDEFDALDDAQRNEVYVAFLNAHPDHPQNIDNGQDFNEFLYFDVDFCLWMGWKIIP